MNRWGIAQSQFAPSWFAPSRGQIVRSLDYDASALCPGVDDCVWRRQCLHRANADLPAKQSRDRFGDRCQGFRRNCRERLCNGCLRLSSNRRRCASSRRFHLSGLCDGRNGSGRGPRGSCLLQNSDACRQRIYLPLKLKADLRARALQRASRVDRHCHPSGDNKRSSKPVHVCFQIPKAESSRASSADEIRASNSQLPAPVPDRSWSRRVR